MCKIHSIGCKADFVDFVNNLSSTILNSLAEYKQTFTFDRLLKAVAAKFPADEVFIVHQDISLIESALKEKKLMTWGDLVFENPLSCKGINPKSKLLIIFSLSRFTPAVGVKYNRIPNSPWPIHLNQKG